MLVFKSYTRVYIDIPLKVRSDYWMCFSEHTQYVHPELMARHFLQWGRSGKRKWQCNNKTLLRDNTTNAGKMWKIKQFIVTKHTGTSNTHTQGRNHRALVCHQFHSTQNEEKQICGSIARLHQLCLFFSAGWCVKHCRNFRNRLPRPSRAKPDRA